ECALGAGVRGLRGGNDLEDAHDVGPGGHPDAAGHETGGSVDVKVESRSPALSHRAHLATGIAVVEPGSGVGLVRRLVLGEADVAVDPEHRALGIADDLGRDAAQPGVERLDELAHRLPHLPLIDVTVGLEPGLLVVPRQISQEPERSGSKSSEAGYRQPPGSVMASRTLAMGCGTPD